MAELRRHDADRLTDGSGLAIVVNPGAGPPWTNGVLDQLREELPAAEVIELGGDDDPAVALRRAAASDARAIGIVGGDGSVGVAAAIAAEHSLPLVVVPGGTLNHLARAAGLATVDDTIAAVKAGTVVEVDIARVDGGVFVNTASVGCYPDLVDLRDRLRRWLGKWPSAALALAMVLPRTKPLELEIDGVPRRVWTLFVGNCRYDPPRGAPRSRRRLDDGVLDVRVLRADLRIERRTATALRVGIDTPVRLARDGETCDASSELRFEKDGTRVAVYAPAPS